MENTRSIIVKENHNSASLVPAIKFGYSNSLSRSEQLILQNRYENIKIGSMSQSDIEFMCIDIVNKAFLDSGITIKGNTEKEQAGTIANMAVTFAQDLIELHPDLTMQEVSMAVRLGIREHYGQFYGVNIASLNKFINSYKESESLKEAIRKQHEFNRAQQEKLEQEEENRIRKEKAENSLQSNIKMCADAFHDFIFKRPDRNNLYLYDLGNVRYDFLSENGIISFTNERKTELLREAKRIEAQSVPLNAISQFLSSMEAAKNSGSIIVYAKKLALFEFFDDLLSMDMGIEELFKEKGLMP